MRIRTIKPEFFLHDGLFDAEAEAQLPLRLAYAGLWCCADREGRFKWEPRRLGAQILPYDNIDFSRVLDALLTRGFLVKYGSFGAIPSWRKHQVVNHRERKSVLPAPPENTADLEQSSEGNADACPTRAPRVTETPGGKGKGREGKGKEVGGASSHPNTRANDEEPKNELVDDQTWLETVAADPGYAGIEVRKEFAKMTNWCAVNGKRPTRRRFINWLNRIEAPIKPGASDLPRVNY